MKPKVPETSHSTPTTRLLYHGDFDWGGVRSATPLARSVPWRPWRYTAPEYRAAKGPPAAPLGPALAVALAECGVRAEGETVLNDLLTDLGAQSR
ncbi:DUF2399 domain-containing protein [Streptomyces sp. NPDC045251]|uniref:DUF2399 domain-containing protein n=1 Tax=unclassified Streptomyces TaxID=2593676 RepID=UPI0033E6EBBC